MTQKIAFIFDLDGTLVDSVYAHVLAWQQAFLDEDIPVSGWSIHRRIGMSGDLFVRTLLREQKIPATAQLSERLSDSHKARYEKLSGILKPLPGAFELLRHLKDTQTDFAIATTAEQQTAEADLKRLGVDSSQVVLITRADVQHGKPDPEIFQLAAQRLNLDVRDAIVVGDSIWDMLCVQRAGGFGVGLLSGGYAKEELERAGAHRVYVDALDLLAHLEEVGGPRPPDVDLMPTNAIARSARKR